jgi:spermidine/putrescine transport system substrate-binding protein
MVLGAVCLALLTGASVSAQAGSTAWECPPGYAGQTLNVWNWSAYIADNTIPDFEILCDVTVNYDVYVSNEDMIARLRQGNPGYDIVVPTGYALELMIAEDLLQPLDLDMLPNLENISPDLLNTPFDPGNQYSVPYQWGTIGIAYNINAVTETPTSWYDLFESDLPVAWLEDPRGMLAIALNLLGYNPNTSDEAEIAEARDFLVENGENVVAIVAADSRQLLEAGEVVMAIDYPGNVFQLRADCECEDFLYVIPEEGTALWMDNVAIPTDAPNPELAHVFMDYLLDAQVAADLSNYTGYGSPNQAAIDDGLIDTVLLEDPGIYPPADVRERMWFTESNPDGEVFFNEAWDEVRALLNQ